MVLRKQPRGRQAAQPPTPPKSVEEMTRGEKVIAFIETYCRVSEGKDVGKPMVLKQFQKDFILAVYDNPVGTSKAILSIGRKNGKTALIASLVLAHLVGPVAIRNSQVISGAHSKDQAALVFKHMRKMVNLEPKLQRITRIVPSTKLLLGLPLNTEYSAISAEAKTAHGLSPVVAILDEIGQIRGPQSDFVDAVETSQGAHDGPILFAISTQAASDSDLFSQWIDDALASKDPHIVCHVYASDKDCDLLDEEQWIKSNPALGAFRSLDDMRKLAEKADRMPSFAATFRNLNLNQRVETYSPFVSRDVWKTNGAPPNPANKKVKAWAGLDLSSVSDLCAWVLVTEHGDVHCTFWLPEEGIKDKSKTDRVPYDLWAEQGFLRLTAGRTIQYENVAKELRGLFEQFDIQKVAFDRYNMKFLRPWLVEAKFPDSELAKFVEFGQGFASMSPALRELEVLLLEGKLRHGNHPVLTMCAANAVTVSDPAGNRKLAKNKATGRIDGMVSLAMAVGVLPVEKEREPTHQLFFA